jgi:ABC-2 type transport system permease protein
MRAGALAVCERDVRKFIKQPAVMAASIIGPLLTLILLGSAYGGAITHAPVAVVRESYGPFTSKFVDILRNEQSCAFGGINCQNSFQIYDVAVIDTAQEMLREGRVKGIVRIPLGFDRSLSDKVNVIVTVSLDNTDPLSAASIGAEVSQANQQLSSNVQISIPLNTRSTVDLEDAYRNILYIEFMAPGTLCQSVMFVSIIAGGVQLVHDKERGIIEGYLVTPLKRYEIVGGVLLSGVIKALISILVLFALAIIVAGVRPIPNMLRITLTIFTLFLTSLGIIAMMTAYAVRFTSADLYRVSCFPFNLVLYYTSGAVYPLEGFPTWMRQISMINPEAYAVHALRLLMYRESSLSSIAGDFTFLAVFTGLMMALAVVAFKRSL